MRKGLLETVITGASTRTSHAQVVNELGKAIIAGDFPIGAILPGDAELAQRFKVSRTVLREAMKTLAAKGLIVPRARIGCVGPLLAHDQCHAACQQRLADT